MEDSDVEVRDKKLIERRKIGSKFTHNKDYHPCNNVERVMIRVSSLLNTLIGSDNQGFITPQYTSRER